MKRQVLYIGSDACSAKLFAALGSAFPHLRAIYLDEVHLPIIYNQAHWRKKTPGEKVLRVLMNKFNKIDLTVSADIWGDFYAGAVLPDHSMQVEHFRRHLYNGTMTQSLAKRTIENIDPEVPWYNIKDFVMAMAALTTIYWHEVDRPTHANGKKLYHVLWCATAPERVNWYFNNLRVRHALPVSYTHLPLPTILRV